MTATRRCASRLRVTSSPVIVNPSSVWTDSDRSWCVVGDRSAVVLLRQALVEARASTVIAQSRRDRMLTMVLRRCAQGLQLRQTGAYKRIEPSTRSATVG